jgi:hypothetical protein
MRHPIEEMVEAKLRSSRSDGTVELDGNLAAELVLARRISDLAELNHLAQRLVVLGFLLEEKHRSPAAAQQVVSFVTALLPALSRFLGAPKGARWAAAQAFLKKESAATARHAGKGLRAASPAVGVGLQRRRPK